MTISKSTNKSVAGMTLVEVMIAMTIAGMAIAGATATFLSGLRMMYKDTQRLENSSTLRRFLSTVSKSAVDATEFYLFPNHTALDGSVDLSTAEPADWPTSSSISKPYDNAYDSQTAVGDCLVLITRESTSSTAKMTSFRVFYRVGTNLEVPAPLRMYERIFATPSASSPASILNTVNTSLAPGKHSAEIRVVELAAKAIGRKDSGGNRSPVFSTAIPFPTPEQENVAINVEVIHGTKQQDQLSSSSFNYIVSPRK